MGTKQKLATNINKFYLFQIFWMFWLAYAVNVVFYRVNNISISQITIIDVFWGVAAFVLEIPTGALSDRWSRKNMLVLSSLFASIGFFIFSISSSFFPFVIASMFMAARFSFASGTSNALLYDSLLTLKRNKEYEKILGKSKLFGLASISIAGIIGSYFAQWNIRIPFVLSIFSSGIAAIIAATFTEPTIRTSTGETTFFVHIKDSVRFVLTHQLVRFLLIYLVIMDIAISYLDEYDQLYLTAINFPLAYFGLWIALRRGLLGLGNLWAAKFKSSPRGRIKSVALIVMLLSLLIISFAGKIAGLLAFLCIFPVWGIVEVLISGELQAKVESFRRATIESLIVFFGVIVDIPARLGFGYISDKYGIRTGYLYVALILFLYLPYFIWKKARLGVKA